MLNYIRGVGSVVLLFACITMLVAGLTIVLKPTPRPAWLGVLILAVSGVIISSTVTLWSRILPSIFGCGALNGFFMIASGHLIGQPDRPVSKLDASEITGILLVLAMLADKACGHERPVDRIDRPALAFLVSVLSVAIVFDSSVVRRIAGAVMICTLGCLLLRHHRERARQSKRKSTAA